MDFDFSGRCFLITGGAGFIGSNLADRLLSLGAEVTVLDNFSTGKKANLQAAWECDRFHLITGDIRDADLCQQVTRNMDTVIHLAALGSVPRSIKDPCTSTAVNISGFVNMIFAAHQSGVKKFVYASSSSVYGDSPDLPKYEGKTGKPLSPYALTKAVDELFAENFHRIYNIDTIGLRFFNVFGRRQDPDGAYAAVIPKFAAALLEHRAPVINGDGTFSRDFTYIDNVLQVICRTLVCDDADAWNQIYNVACGAQMSLNELFTQLRHDLAEFDPVVAGIEPVYGQCRPGDIPHSLADINKAEKLLKYIPEISAGEGISLTAKWYFENLKTEQ